MTRRRDSLRSARALPSRLLLFLSHGSLGTWQGPCVREWFRLLRAIIVMPLKYKVGR